METAGSGAGGPEGVEPSITERGAERGSGERPAPVFDNGLQEQPPEGLTRFGRYYFEFVSKINTDDSYMEWLINTFDEPKREDLSYLNNQIQLSIYAEPEVVNDIGKAALAGHTDHAAIMAGEIGLMDEEVVELRARVCMFCDMWDNALRFIEDYHSQMHFSEWLFEFAADVMYRMNKTDKLDELCKAWTGHGYDRINLHLNRARVLCMKGLLKEGLDIAEAILLLEPTHSLTHLLRGNILATRRLHDDAIGAFKQGLKYGDDPLLRLGLAKSLYATGKRQQAQRLRDELVADGVGAKILAGLQ